MNSLIPPDRSPPSIAAVALASAILAAAAGYIIGQASSLGLFSSRSSSSSRGSKRKPSGKNSWPNSYDVTVHPDSSDDELMAHLNGGPREKEIADSEDDSEEEEEEEEEEEQQGELKSFEGNTEECKLVLAVRTDLGMSKGKIAAQASHATLACYTHLLARAPTTSPLLHRWQSLGQAKIAVQISSEAEMAELHARAVGLGLCARVVRDAGRTQVAGGTATVLGVGPGPRSVVDGVTGGLKLL